MKKLIVFSILCIFIMGTATACMYEQGNYGVLGANNILYNENEEWGTLYPFIENGLWGFRDNYGEVIVEPQYLYVRSFSEGLAFVRGVEGKEYQTGFVDLTGQLIIPLPTIFYATNFSEGFAIIREWDGNQDIPEEPEMSVEIGSIGHVIFIDRMGNDVFGQKFHSALPFSDGLALVRGFDDSEYQAGFINTTGELVISLPNVIQGGSFFEGFAHLIVREWDWANNETPMSVSLPGPFIFIDKTGQNAFDMEFGSADRFRDGFARVSFGIGMQYIDRYGNITDMRP